MNQTINLRELDERIKELSSFVDSLIIGKDEYFSFHKQDLLLKYTQEYEKIFGTTGISKKELVLAD